MLSCSGCSEPTIHHAQNKLLDIQVLSHGHDNGGEFCADFILTSTQVEWFFSRAKILDARLLHDKFDILPCWVRGTGKSVQGTWNWEIRAGGTARKVFENGTIELLGCDNCDAVLMSEKAYPKK
ncbi:MAG: hypothetical protein JNL74_00390 [Fibrobacteres bacterium]|nr:hypothetical protein [Fibrobacterota bacterium]